MEIRFNGTIEEIKAEMRSFLGMEKTEKASEPVKLTEPIEVEVPQAPVVPVATTTYTLADLQKIAGEFVQKDKNNKNILVNILSSMEVRALTQLSEVQFGSFIQKLKEAGADI